MLATLWQSFFAICCFRKKPQDLPASRELLVLVLVSYAIGSILLTLSSQSTDAAVASGVIDALLLALITYAVLACRGKAERWLQATTALSGTGLIFTLAAVPLSYLLANLDQQDPLAVLVFLFVISLLVWNIGVMAHILRHALSTSFAWGVLTAFLYVWLITAAITHFFPQAAAA